MSIHDQIASAIEHGRPVLLALDGGEVVRGILEGISEPHTALDGGWPGAPAHEDRAPSVRVALGGGLVELIDLRRVRAVRRIPR